MPENTEKILKELKNRIAEGNLLIGSKSVLKNLKIKKINLVILSSNSPLRKDIEHYAKLSNIKISEFPGTGKELGVFCGKPFSISCLGFKVVK